MPADAGVLAICAYHHGHGIPANDALYPALDFTAAGENRLALDRNGVDVRGIGSVVELDTALLGLRLKAAQQLSNAVRALIRIHIVE